MNFFCLQVCANIFNKYFCNTERKDYADPKFCNYVDAFDEIFFEVNNGRAMDFLPWLAPFMQSELAKVKGWANRVRGFVDNEIIEPKRESRANDQRRTSADAGPQDFLDGLMDYIDGEASLDEVKQMKIHLRISAFLNVHLTTTTFSL